MAAILPPISPQSTARYPNYTSTTSPNPAFNASTNSATSQTSRQSRGHLQTNACSGYTGHLPGSNQAYGVNFGIQKKITSGLLASERKADLKSLLKTDKWGNALVNDPSVKPQLINSYLTALDPSLDLDFTIGVGKPRDAPPARREERGPTDPSSILQNMNFPFRERPKPAAPPRIVGYTGHRPGAVENNGESFGKIEMRNPEVAKQLTYETFNLTCTKQH